MTITAFYKFTHLPDYRDLRAPLQQVCEENGVKGTILLAEEGINGTVSGPTEGVAALIAYLRSEERLGDLETKVAEAPEDQKTFYRMKVRLKKEIVTLGVEGIDPNRRAGTYVDPKEWNALIEDPEVLLIDTRNDYEVEVGTFSGAVDPKTTSFREFPEYVEKNLDPTVHRKVAMFCTGGIRCEKASAYMLEQGFEEVYHLKGGILKYLEEVPEEESSWQGECYVFDHRVAVNHNLEPGSHDLCYACRRPLSKEDRTDPDYHYGVSCARCITEFTDQDRERFAERARQIELAEKRGEGHLG